VQPASQEPQRDDQLGEDHKTQVSISLSSRTCAAPCRITATISVVDKDSWDVNKLIVRVGWFAEGLGEACTEQSADTYTCAIPNGGTYAIQVTANGTRMTRADAQALVTASGAVPPGGGGTGGSGGGGGTGGSGGGGTGGSGGGGTGGSGGGAGSPGGACGGLGQVCCPDGCNFHSGLVCRAGFDGNRCFAPTSMCGAPFQPCCDMGATPFCDTQTFPGVRCGGVTCTY